MTTARLSLAIVIPARDEATVLGATLERLQTCIEPGDTLIVIDDGSEDETAQIAEHQGAKVLIRPPSTPQPPFPPNVGEKGGEGSPLPFQRRGAGGVGSEGKAAALRWWLESTEPEPDRYLGIIILDADTLVADDFLTKVRARLAGGAQAIQGLVIPVRRESSAAGWLADCSELLEQRVDDRIRAALKWPVRLRGTGMAFRPMILRAVAPRLKTQVEDVELSLLLTARGERIVFAPEARVYDPKPADDGAAVRQRARWLRGQWQVWRSYWPLILRLLLSGPGAWSLIQSTLIKPRTLVALAKMLFLAGLLIWESAPFRFGLVTLTSLSLAVDLIYFAIGLLLIARPAEFARVLLLAPGYGRMWLGSLILALRSPGTWLRARPHPPPQPDGHPSSLSRPLSREREERTGVVGEAVTVAVIIPALNGHKRLPALLRALCSQERPLDEVLIVDGNAEAMRQCAEDFARMPPPFCLRLIDNPSGAIPLALNLGICSARSEVIVRMDTHALPGPDYLRRCLEVLEASGADVVGGRWVIKPGGDGAAAEAIALAVGHALAAGDARYRLQTGARAGDVDTVPYGCFHRALWQRLGGFNEALLTNEDYEFNWRVRANGGRIYFDPSIRSEYYARPTLRALAQQYFRYGWWKVQMLRRHPTSLRWRQLLPIVALAALLVSAAAAPFVTTASAALLGLSGIYLSLVAAATLQLALRRRSAAVWLALPVAFAIIHFSWSVGAWVNLLAGGRWPEWPTPGRKVSRGDA